MTTLRRLAPIGFAVAAVVALAGCPKARSCRDGTLLVAVSFTGASTSADSLQVTVEVGGTIKSGTPIAKRSANSGTIEVDFAGGSYPRNQSVTVTVDALMGGVVVGTGQQTITLGGSCQQLSISVSDVAAANDMSVGDLATDGGNDLGVTSCASTTCPTGFCSDGVCCDKPCLGQCEACNVPGSVGTCVAVTGAPQGARPACAGTGTTCGGQCNGTNRTGCAYPGASTSCGMQSCLNGVKTLAVNCDGSGNCPQAQQLSCAPPSCNAAGTDCAIVCMSNTDCNGVTGKPYCDHGVCTAHMPNGSACTMPGNCNSGFCVDGYCCDQACGGQCQACDVSGSVGTCTPVTSGQPHGTRSACSGSGVCQGSCAAGQTQTCTFPTTKCAGGTCANGVATPPVNCNNGSCPSVSTVPCANGFACNSSGTACLPGPCSADTDCQSGYYCASGGTCMPQKTQGQTCNLTSDCANSSGCRECTTGFCVDGYCCNSACTSQCAACDGATKGTCQAISGAPHDGRPQCTTNATHPMCNGACDGTNTAACAYPTVQCIAQSCTGGVVTLASNCSNGQCVAPNPPTQTCASNMCMGTVCGGCTSDANCGTGKYCDATGTCQTQKGNGVACGQKGSSNPDCYNSAVCAECSSTFCVDGYCCGTACTGQCQNCNANPGTCQLTGTAANPVPPVSNAGTSRPACNGTAPCTQLCNGSSATMCADPSPEPSCRSASCSGGVGTLGATCSGGSCPAVQMMNCTPYICGATACTTSCAKDTDCASTAYCDNTGHCQTKKPQGGTCALSGTTNTDCYNNGNCAECATGYCVGGYCCNSACTQPCDTCNGNNGLPAGTCGPAPGGTTPLACKTLVTVCSGSCNGTTETCTYPSGNACTLKACSGTCSSGACNTMGYFTCGTACCDPVAVCINNLCQ